MTSIGEPVVVVEDLVRTFRVRPRRRGVKGALVDLVAGRGVEVRALDGVSLTVHAGEVLGYIGPNGAGKSTTVKCVTGILEATAGRVRVCGLDPWRDRRRHVRNMGVVFGQRTQLWWDLAVIEAYDLLASVFGVSAEDYRRRLGELTSMLELGPLLRTPVRELSLGQRVRCDLGAALLHGPKVAVLDEPTIGLDVSVKQRMRDFIRMLAAERGVAVLLTTHDLGDVERLCDRIALIDRGHIVYDGALDSLRRRLGGRRRVVIRGSDALSDADVSRLDASIDVPIVRDGPATVSVSLEAGQGAGPVVSAVLAGLPGRIEDVAVVEPTIEDAVASFYRDRDA